MSEMLSVGNEKREIFEKIAKIVQAFLTYYVFTENLHARKAGFTMNNMLRNAMGLILMKGCEEFGEKVLYYLKEWNKFVVEPLIEASCPRFATGEAKGIINESVRGKDLFIICDPFNYSVGYEMYKQLVPMSPDDHFQDLKRILGAAGGKEKRVTVIMPALYEGRQDRKTGRESLDCALGLRELVNMGVSNIITFDAHDTRVQNAVPLCGFDNMEPRYQMIKAFLKTYPGYKFERDKVMIVTPDEGGINRSIAYSTVLGLEMGVFSKRRDFKNVVGGTNPITGQEYIGGDVRGKDVIVTDDIIATGNSLLETCKVLKEKGADHIYLFVTFGQFCNGSSGFDIMYDKGQLDKVFITNLIYTPKELLGKPWLVSVDLSKYVAYIIDAIFNDYSVGAIIDPEAKISALLANN